MDKQKEEKKEEILGPALRIFGNFSAWVAGPALLGSMLGLWLDKIFGTEPWILVITVMLAFIVSMIGITKSAVAEHKKMLEAVKKEKNNNQDGTRNGTY